VVARYVIASRLQQVEDHKHRRGRYLLFGPLAEPLEAGDELAVEGGDLTVEDARGRIQLCDAFTSSGKRRVWSRPFRLVSMTRLPAFSATMRPPSYFSS
jgi:hypothetical protein